MGKVKSYLREVGARLKGDEKQVIAEKNYRKATSAINGQIAALKAKEVNDEDAVENATDVLNSIKYPTTLIHTPQAYVRDVVSAQETLDAAKASLEATRASIKFNEDLLEDFNKEVEEV
jgi:hypothetical protein